MNFTSVTNVAMEAALQNRRCESCSASAFAESLQVRKHFSVILLNKYFSDYSVRN